MTPAALSFQKTKNQYSRGQFENHTKRLRFDTLISFTGNAAITIDHTRAM
jgi:hypothetical protein